MGGDVEHDVTGKRAWFGSNHNPDRLHGCDYNAEQIVEDDGFEQPDPDYLEWLIEQTRPDPPEPGDRTITPAEFQAILVRSMSPAELDRLSARMEEGARQRRKIQMIEARRASRRLASWKTQRCRRHVRPRSRSRRASPLRHARPNSRAGDAPGLHERSEPTNTTSPVWPRFTPDMARRLGSVPPWWEVGYDIASGSVWGWS